MATNTKDIQKLIRENKIIASKSVPITIPAGTRVSFVGSSRLTSTYDFGYNIGSKETWNTIWSSSLFPGILDQMGPQHIRYPGGALNYWDWDTQTTNTEFKLPSDTLPASTVAFYQNLVEPKNISTLWGVNMLTSSVANGTPLLNQQTSSLLAITNSYHMPINRIELGSEFYLSDPPMYVEKYPSGSNYGKEAAKWMSTFRTIFPTAKYCVPVVDTRYSSNASRRLGWNSQSIAEYVKSSSIPDAFAIHSYPTVTETEYDNITNWVLTASYTEFENISASIAKVYTFSPSVTSSNFWITEYNLIDNSDLNSGKSISGTWAHGLYNLSQTFLLMNHPKITLGTHHSTHAGRYFGMIFHNTSAFGNSTSDTFDFSATGLLISHFGSAYKDSDSYDSLTINDSGFLGKVFRSSTSGDKFIFMNLSPSSYSLNLSEILTGQTISSVTASYADPTLLVNKKVGSTKLFPSQSFYTSFTTEQLTAYQMQPYEVTYIKCAV
jgi:hypothetical protein